MSRTARPLCATFALLWLVLVSGCGHDTPADTDEAVQGGPAPTSSATISPGASTPAPSDPHGGESSPGASTPVPPDPSGGESSPGKSSEPPGPEPPSGGAKPEFTVVPPSPEVSDKSGGCCIFGPGRIDFGTITVGERSDPTSTGVTNDPRLRQDGGQGTVEIAAVTIASNVRPDPFHATDDCVGVVLEVGERCTFEVTFGPFVAGSVQGALTIEVKPEGIPAFVTRTGLSGVGRSRTHASPETPTAAPRGNGQPSPSSPSSTPP